MVEKVAFPRVQHFPVLVKGLLGDLNMCFPSPRLTTHHEVLSEVLCPHPTP